LRPVSALNAQCNLGEDEFRLLSSVHGTKGLDLQLAENLCGSLEVTLLLLDVGEDLGHAGPLNLDKDLALGYCPQRLDHRKLGLEIGRLVEEADDGLDHLGDGLLELAVLLGEYQGLVVHQTPVSCVLA